MYNTYHWIFCSETSFQFFLTTKTTLVHIQNAHLKDFIFIGNRLTDKSTYHFHYRIGDAKISTKYAARDSIETMTIGKARHSL